MLVPKPVLVLATNRGVCVRFYHTVYHTETGAQIVRLVLGSGQVPIIRQTNGKRKVDG